jgi:hypothetical protein
MLRVYQNLKHEPPSSVRARSTLRTLTSILFVAPDVAFPLPGGKGKDATLYKIQEQFHVYK